MHGVEVVADVSDMRHRADEGEVLGQRGQPAVQFRDAHAGHGRGNGIVRPPDFSGRAGLEIPGVDVARAAAKQDENAGTLGGLTAQALARIDAGGHHSRGGHGQRANPAGLEDLPP